MNATIFRIEKTSNYTVMSNYHFKDKNLTLKAKGLLSLMLSLPDDWDYSMNGLVAICKENITAIKSAINELIDNGYLKIEKIYPNQENNKISYIYHIYEKKQEYIENQNIESQDIENLYVENQHIENNIQLNTNRLNTKELSIKELNTKNKINNIKDKFDIFYNKYPIKKSKDKAFTSFNRIIKKVPFEDIMKGLDNYLKDIQKNKIEKRFIKHPSTWLNQGCWQDEYEAKNNSKFQDLMMSALMENENE